MSDKLEERTIAGLHRALEDELRDIPRTAAVLDLGCGSGAWLARLNRLGFSDTWGVDAVPRSVPGISRFVQANLNCELPPLGNRQFGLISLIEVIEHLANIEMLFALIRRHLSADGRVLITTPNIQSLHCRLRFLLSGRLASFDDKGDPTHVAPLYMPAFARNAARHGLQVERCWTFPPRGTLIFGAGINASARFLRPFFPDRYPGDTLCAMLAWQRKLERS